MFFLSTLFLGLLTIINIGTWLTLTEYHQFNLIFSGVILLGLCSLIIAYRKKFQDFYHSRWFKQVMGGATTIALVMIMLGFVNYLGYKNSKTFDFSGRHLHSLPPEMKDILSELKKPLKVTVISPSHSFNAFRTYLMQLKEHKKDIQVEYIEPHLRPDILEKFKIQNEQSVILEYGRGEFKKRDIITSFKHLDFARSFKKLLEIRNTRIVFANNHNENSINDESAKGLSSLREFLEVGSVEVEEMNIASNQRHFDFDVLAILGPKIDISEDEIKFLNQAILEKSKSVIIAIDPTVNKDIVPNFRKWINTYGLAIKNSFVIDKYSFVNGSKGTVPLVQSQWGGQKNYLLKFPVFFPLTSHIEAMKVEREDLANKITIEPILVTTQAPHSWAETNHQEMIDQNYLFNKEQDALGPVTLTAMAKIQNKGSVLALGNSKFVENTYQKFKNNFDFLIKNIEHFATMNSNLKLTLPMVKEEPLFINGTQINLIFYLTVFILPLLGGIGAFVSYRMRLK